MRVPTYNLLAAFAVALWLPSPVWAEDSAAKGGAGQDAGFFEELGDDAGDFFSGVGNFFSDDVPEFFTEDVPAAFDGSGQPQSAARNPYAGSPKLLTDKASIKEAQALLNQKGFDAGPADGLPGRKTRSAVAEYQKSNGIVVTGQVTDQLLLHLKGVRPPAPNIAKAEKKKDSEPAGSDWNNRDR